jgi:hypothetical protein
VKEGSVDAKKSAAGIILGGCHRPAAAVIRVVVSLNTVCHSRAISNKPDCKTMIVILSEAFISWKPSRRMILKHNLIILKRR